MFPYLALKREAAAKSTSESESSNSRGNLETFAEESAHGIATMTSEADQPVKAVSDEQLSKERQCDVVTTSEEREKETLMDIAWTAGASLGAPWH